MLTSIIRNTQTCLRLSLVGVCLATAHLLLPTAALALAEDYIVMEYMVESYRQYDRTCQGAQLPPATPLMPLPALREVAAACATGMRIEDVLVQKGLTATGYAVLYSAATTPQDAFAGLRQTQCERMMQNYSHIGAAYVNNQWWIVLAAISGTVPPQANNTASGPAYIPQIPETTPQNPLESNIYSDPLPETGAGEQPLQELPVEGYIPTPALLEQVDIGKSPASLVEAKSSMLSAINRARSQARQCGEQAYPAAPAMRLHAGLTNAAQKHADDMIERNYFAAQNPEGKGTAARVEDEHYTWQSIGETRSRGIGDAVAVLNMWLRDANSCTNVMQSGVEDLGVGYSKGIWVVITGSSIPVLVPADTATHTEDIQLD